jgi:putative transposase
VLVGCYRVGAPCFSRGDASASRKESHCDQSGFSPASRGRCDNVGCGMLPAAQETRTFFTSFATWERRFILQSNPLCDLLLAVIRENRTRHRFQVHEFVFMRNHVHLILTPAPLVSLEKAMQLIKGGFSYRARREMIFQGEIWQKGYNEHRIRDADEYAKHVEYLWMNPVKAGLAEHPEEYPYSSARLKAEVDPAPLQFQPKPRG